MPTTAILNSHPLTVLKKEVSKTNIKGYSKMKKAELIVLMMTSQNRPRFHHIKMRERKAGEVVIKTVKKKIQPKQKAERATKISAPQRQAKYPQQILAKKRVASIPKVINTSNERVSRLPDYLPQMHAIPIYFVDAGHPAKEYVGQKYFTDRYAYGSTIMQSKWHDGAIYMVRKGKWFLAGEVHFEGGGPNIKAKKDWIKLPERVKLYKDNDLREQWRPEIIQLYNNAKTQTVKFDLIENNKREEIKKIRGGRVRLSKTLKEKISVLELAEKEAGVQMKKYQRIADQWEGQMLRKK
jgi:hypothetical protein